MIKSSYIDPKFDLNLGRPANANLVSFSQFSTFYKCPLSWKLAYVDRLRDSEESIHTVFGDSMHNVIQAWTKVMYTETIKAAMAMDLRKMLLQEMLANYDAALESIGSNFSTKEELTEFYRDGAETLSWMRSRRKRYFDPSNEILVGTEVPLVIDLGRVYFVAYLDFVVQEKVSKKIKIIDFKTSGKGWNEWITNDEVKISQIILYKMFFAQQYNIPIDTIDVEYLILKRKVNPDAMYPVHRVQRFVPASGKIKTAQVRKKLDSFLQSCFLPDGSFNTLYNYTACSGYNDRNCKFCPFESRYDLCPVEKRQR